MTRLAGGPLAVAVDAPLLLSLHTDVSDVSMAAIDRVLADGGTVHVLGGSAALDPVVDEELRAAGYEVVRHAGAERFETSVRVAEALGTPSELVLADGSSFADAVIAAPVAASRGGALLLTNHQALPDVVRPLVEAEGVRVAAVGAAAASAFPAADQTFTGEVTGAVDGDVAALAFPHATRVGIARNDAFPDALAGGALLGRAPAGPVLLVATDAVPTRSAAPGGSSTCDPAPVSASVTGTSASTSPRPNRAAGHQRVGVIHEAAAHERDRLEAAVRMLGEAGHQRAVVHQPPVAAGEGALFRTCVGSTASTDGVATT